VLHDVKKGRMNAVTRIMINQTTDKDYKKGIKHTISSSVFCDMCVNICRCPPIMCDNFRWSEEE